MSFDKATLSKLTVFQPGFCYLHGVVLQIKHYLDWANTILFFSSFNNTFLKESIKTKNLFVKGNPRWQCTAFTTWDFTVPLFEILQSVRLTTYSILDLTDVDSNVIQNLKMMSFVKLFSTKLFFKSYDKCFPKTGFYNLR